MGSFPALILAARIPDLVTRLVFLCPAPLAITSRQRWLAALPVVGSLLATVGIWHGNRNRAATFQAFVRAAAHPERMSVDPVAVAAANEATDRFIASSPLALGRSVHHALRTRSTHLATAVTQPTLVMVGDHDRVGRPEHARALAGALPRGRLIVLPDCGHYPFLESAGTVANEVIAHLRAGS
jgi:pimeloyl-ACP methyl ester carboxylesterase